MKGFTDKSGKFRPTEKKIGVRKSRDQYVKTEGIKISGIRKKRFDATVYVSEPDTIDPVNYIQVDAKNIKDARKIVIKKLKKLKFQGKPNFDKFVDIVGDSNKFPESNEIILSDNIERSDKSGEFVFEVEIRENKP